MPMNGSGDFQMNFNSMFCPGNDAASCCSVIRGAVHGANGLKAVDSEVGQ